MPTTNNLRKGLNRKQWELCHPMPTADVNGTCAVNAYDARQIVLWLQGSNVTYLYTAQEDGWVQIQAASLLGTFGTGTAVAAVNVGPTGTATGGSTTTINTNLSLARNLAGYKIHITGGPNGGETKTILRNTVGANSVITIDGSPFSTAITTASTYRLLTPRWYCINGGAQSVGSFKFYCYALNTWSSGLSVTGFTASSTNDGRLVSTPSHLFNEYKSFATGTATGGSANTIVNSAKTWTTNQWSNSQVRIVSGTGAGQIRSISSNTGTTITVATNWTTNPDATSVYSIEGNDDYLYFTGASSSTFYRYNITANTWTTLTARPSATGAGTLGAEWIWDTADAGWNDENNIINGRRIYSFLSQSGNTLQYYDIALNSWTSLSYANQQETIGVGTKYAYCGDFIYIMQLTGTTRCLRYNVVNNEIEGWHNIIYTQQSVSNGHKGWIYRYIDGATTINYVYTILNGTAILIRTLII